MQQLVRLRDTRGAAPRLWLVTRGSQGEDPTALMQAPLWGLGRSFALEYPDLWGGLVDLPATADVETMAVLLHRELCAGDAEDQVMWRDGHRFVPRLAPSPESVSITAPSALRDDASYWVVGGLGRLGILTAEALITAGARHLMLTGRREPDATAKLTLESLRERAQIHVMVADIGSEEATRAVIARVAQTMPPLRGVIHTAAVFEDALIANLTPGILSRVFRPKIKGSWNLHRATTALDLDFFILFSSVLSLWGAAGQAAPTLPRIPFSMRLRITGALSVCRQPCSIGDHGRASLQTRAGVLLRMLCGHNARLPHFRQASLSSVCFGCAPTDPLRSS